LQPATASMFRTPGGHPEGYIEAFATIYRAFAATIRGSQVWFPGVDDGLRTMRFVEAVVANAGSDVKWSPIDIV
jgi:predicted dehydrogenase